MTRGETLLPEHVPEYLLRSIPKLQPALRHAPLHTPGPRRSARPLLRPSRLRQENKTRAASILQIIRRKAVEDEAARHPAYNQ